MSDLRIDHDIKHGGQYVVYSVNRLGRGPVLAAYGTLAAAKAGYPEAQLEAGVPNLTPAATKASIWDEPMPTTAPSARVPQQTQVAPARPPYAPWVTMIAALGIALIVVSVLWSSDHSNLSAQIVQGSSKLTATESQLSTTQANLYTAQREAAHPTLGLWNAAQTIQANGAWSTLGMPDTFDLHLNYTSDVQVTYAFVTLDEYPQFVACANQGGSYGYPLNYLMGCLYVLGGQFTHDGGSTNSRWGAGTSIFRDFVAAEGCAGWLVLFFPYNKNQAARLQPNISVTYNPSSVATPPCG
jgi:hypothetical protein